MKERSVLFWDFDGVIKESVEIKSHAYVALFAQFGEKVVAQIRSHHEAHGGMSRFEKIPLYLSWSGQSSDAAEVARYCLRFAHTVRERVIDSPWVPGAREYLEQNHSRQCCVVLTATPQEEIEGILAVLQIASWFREVHGAPTPKAQAIAATLSRWQYPASKALVIGDSWSDYEAARGARVDFLLRRTPANTDLQRTYPGPQCENFIDG